MCVVIVDGGGVEWERESEELVKRRNAILVGLLPSLR